MKLKFVNHDAKFVCEAFGIEEPKYEQLKKAMETYFAQLDKADNHEVAGKSEKLEEFLTSIAFREVEFPLETGNDYFILGYTFAHVLHSGDDTPSFLEFLKAMAATGRMEVREGRKKDSEGGMAN